MWDQDYKLSIHNRTFLKSKEVLDCLLHKHLPCYMLVAFNEVGKADLLLKLEEVKSWQLLANASLHLTLFQVKNYVRRILNYLFDLNEPSFYQYD